MHITKHNWSCTLWCLNKFLHLHLTHSQCINNTLRILLYSIKTSPVKYNILDISIPVLQFPVPSPYHHSGCTNGHIFQRRVHYHCSHNLASHSLTVYTSEGERLTLVAWQQPYSNLESTAGKNNNHSEVSFVLDEAWCVQAQHSVTHRPRKEYNVVHMTTAGD